MSLCYKKFFIMNTNLTNPEIEMIESLAKRGEISFLILMLQSKLAVIDKYVNWQPYNDLTEKDFPCLLKNENIERQPAIYRHLEEVDLVKNINGYTQFKCIVL